MKNIQILDASEKTGELFTMPLVARGLAVGDIDTDGDLDVLMTTNGGSPHLVRNDGISEDEGISAITIILRGRYPNLNALGAVATVTAGDLIQKRMVRTGSSYLSQSSQALLFGLGVRERADRVEVTWSDGTTDLVRDLEAGFEKYEWRWRLAENPPRQFDKPVWNGGSLDGRTVLLHAEQGMGDSIQFARYVARVAKRSRRVVLECQKPLVNLFATLEGPAEIAARGEVLPEFDLHAPLLSLPRIFNTRLDQIPIAESYLAADPARGIKFAKTLEAKRFNIGLAWAGKPTHRNDRNRTVGIEPFITLLGTPGCTFHSLQIGQRAEDIFAYGCTGLIHDHANIIEDFADTAALVSALDLVISVDTSICHLAGALGKPCWVVLPYTPDWRWLMAREDSPWYPSLRLFRQKSFGDWLGVFARIDAELKAITDV